MNHFLLPHSHPFLFKKCNVYIHHTDTATTSTNTHTNNHPQTTCSSSSSSSVDSVAADNSYELGSLPHYLYEIKEKIQLYDSQWDIYKEFTNPYEYIHTFLPNKRYSISQYKPLSRSYFKMIEIMQEFQLLNAYLHQPICSFHLAEGPGGFIEALLNARLSTTILAIQEKDQYYGMTLINEKDKSIPSWKKIQSFLRKNTANVRLEYGATQTGDLLQLANFVYCAEHYANKMHILTGDGGFDMSDDFNNQEKSILSLLVAQICFALCMQKYGGVFILKVFDCFTPATMDLLYLLTGFYEKVYITKPHTSRYANSERYIVCLNFHFHHLRDYYPYILQLYKSNLCFFTTPSPPALSYTIRYFPMDLPRFFVSKLEEYNSILGRQQIDTIYATLLLMENKMNKKGRIDYLIKYNTTKCFYWCNKYGVVSNTK